MRLDWYDITSLQCAITLAILRGDTRGEAVLRGILKEVTR